MKVGKKMLCKLTSPFAHAVEEQQVVHQCRGVGPPALLLSTCSGHQFREINLLFIRNQRWGEAGAQPQHT